MKKTVILALALILCLALASCKGPDDKQGAANTPEPEKATAAPTEAPTEEPTPEPTPEPIPTGAPYLRVTSKWHGEEENMDGERIKEYDAYGNLLRHYEAYGEEGMPLFDDTYEYNEHGDQIKKQMHEAYYVYEWEYDEAGRHVKQTAYYSDGEEEPRLNWYLFYTYSEDGLLAVTELYTFEDRLISTVEYDEAGRRIRSYGGDPEASSDEYLYEYDEHGEQTSYIQKYYSNGELRQETTERYYITYDENGNMTEWIQSREETSYGNHEPERMSMKRTYAYDEEGRVIKEYYYEYDDGAWELVSTTTSEYEIVYGG